MEDGLFHLAVGRFEAQTTAELERFLAFLGSRLVFMIDWNRARKRLRGLVGKRAAVELLGWAAEHDTATWPSCSPAGSGSSTTRSTSPPAGDAGGRLAQRGDRREAAAAYLRSVLRICSDGMLAGRACR